MSAWPGSDEAISVGEAAQLTGASSKSLRRRIERGTLGSVRQGPRRLIPMSELIRVGLLDADGSAPAYSSYDRRFPADAPYQARPARLPRPAASPPRMRAPWSEEPQRAAPAAVPSGSGPAQDRRIAAMVELVMHQTRTIAALDARLARLEARVADLSPSAQPLT